ncbi:probable Na(+)/H(+) antiporter nhx-9 [Palaemon carinicauda]|uniref:probable Na(+)/H(+) antiporter nhx-9 n=1 Tax=Palaemon carinicauda TaxID=392227 RepID=UPI0035B662B0
MKMRFLPWIVVSLWVLGVSSFYTGDVEYAPAIENSSDWETSPLSFNAKMVEHPSEESNTSCGNEQGHNDGIHLASLRWQEVGAYFTVTAFVFVAGFTKIGFHHLHWLSNTIPESCILVVLGAALGLLVFFTTGDPSTSGCDFNIPLPHFTSDMFFFILLPPIVLESAYSLHDRAFFDNLGTVIIYAVIGTMFNIFAIGPTLYGIGALGAMGNITLSLRECLVFSSLISAVDPVAVLVIFQELGVNKDLYFLVFGESLLNDGVTVVIYNTMNTFLSMDSVPAAQYALAVVAFFIVVFGGIAIGIFYGGLTALITKSTADVRVVEPLALFCLAYLCYLTAELFHFSGIISLIVCGLVQAHYAFQNISQKSYACVKYFTKMASATSDTIIFMFLGMVLVSDDHVWHTGFVLWTVFLCLIFRFFGTCVHVTGIMNHYRVKKINIEEQFIAAYGGLRGAVAFSLVEMLDDHLEPKPIFVTTTLVVILFTIFIQGATIKPLVNFLQIQRKRSDRKNLNEEINDTAMDHIMAGVEEVLGQHGDFYLRALMIYYNDKYLKKWLVSPSCESKLQRLFEKIAISEHYAHLYGPVAMIEDHVKPLCKAETARAKMVRASSLSPSIKEQAMLEPRQLHQTQEQDEELHRQFGQKVNNKLALIMEEFNAALNMDAMNSTSNVDGHRLLEFVNNEFSYQWVDKPTRRNNILVIVLTTEENSVSSVSRDNPYNKLHYKYNRNLVDEEDQELSEHLQRRHLNARRMTSFASGSQSSGSFIVHSSRPKTEYCSSEASKDGGRGGGSGALYDGVAELRERHQRRRHTMALRRRNTRPQLQSCLSSPESSSSVASLAPLPPPVTLNTLQETSPQDSDTILTDTTSPKEVGPISRMAAIGGLGSSTERDEEEELALISARTQEFETAETEKEDKV